MRYLVVATLASACATAGEDRPVDAPGSDTFLPRDASIDAPVDLCPTTDTCQAATMLGMVSGDTGSQKVTAMGFRAAWFRVRVTEDDSSVIGKALHITAKLTSPANVNFDVFLYVNAGSDVIECATTTGTITHNGALDTNTATWGEGSVANGSDDGRSVSVEIRPITGACSAGQTWQLEIDGNT